MNLEQIIVKDLTHDNGATFFINYCSGTTPFLLGPPPKTFLSGVAQLRTVLRIDYPHSYSPLFLISGLALSPLFFLHTSGDPLAV